MVVASRRHIHLALALINFRHTCCPRLCCYDFFRSVQEYFRYMYASYTHTAEAYRENVTHRSHPCMGGQLSVSSQGCTCMASLPARRCATVLHACHSYVDGQSIDFQCTGRLARRVQEDAVVYRHLSQGRGSEASNTVCANLGSISEDPTTSNAIVIYLSVDMCVWATSTCTCDRSIYCNHGVVE